MTALIVGLGNPGSDYEATRHNVGQMVIDELARRTSTSLSVNKKLYAKAVNARIGGYGANGRMVTLAKPLSFMNLSGGAVSALAKYTSLKPEQVIVIHDELDIPFGTVRIKVGGGSAGHNGLKDVSKALNTPDYVRIRVGIGRPPGRMDTASFVLKPFSGTERGELPFLIDLAADAAEAVVTEGVTAAQQRFHSA